MRLVGNDLDKLMVPETKIGDTFSESIFNQGFSKLYRLDQTATTGELGYI